MEKKQLLTSQELDVILHRLACQLIENHTDFSDTVLIGLQPRGVFLGQRLLSLLSQEYQMAGIQYGALDITFFRDDFRRGEKPLALPSPPCNPSAAPPRWNYWFSLTAALAVTCLYNPTI